MDPEVKAYRQALWDIYRILGFDTDGDATPDALVSPGLIQLVVDAARESRRYYDEAIRTCDDTYTLDQQRAADYINEITGIGGGEDPVGFLIASHRELSRRLHS